jgi:hypothetical protein
MAKQTPKAVLPTTSPSGRVSIVRPVVNPGLFPTNRSVAKVNPASQKRKGA